MRSLYIKVLLACSLLAAAGCTDRDAGRISIDAASLDVSLTGTNPKSVSFEADRAWYVRIDYSEGVTNKWLDVSPMSGRSGTGTIVVQAVSSNYSGAERSAFVNIILPGDKAVMITVRQPAQIKPQKVMKLTRHMSDGTLYGPAQITLEYDENDAVKAFTASGVRYEVTQNGSTGTIKFGATGSESSASFTILDGCISKIGPLRWEFHDPNTNILLKQSDVTFEFRYDTGENKRLKSVKRTEVINREDAVELTDPRTESESYSYTTDKLRFSSIEHILPYNTAQKEQDYPRDTLIYNFTYPESDDLFEENNLTVNVWDMVALPDDQGIPFYSVTGYWLFGLTGTMQSSFPSGAEVVKKLHSSGSSDAAWPYVYVYSFQRSAQNSIEKALTDMQYQNASVNQRRGTIEFTYEE